MAAGCRRTLALSRRDGGGASPHLILSAATLAQLGASLAQQGVIVLIVYFRLLDHLSLVGMGAVAAAVPLGTMLGMIPAGAAVDRGGVARTALAGCLGLAVSAVCLFLATPGPLWALVVCLFGIGMFAAVMAMAGSGAVFAAFPPQRRATAMGIRQTGVTLGAGVAAALLPTLVATWGLKDVLVALGVPVTVFAVFLARVSAAIRQPVHAPRGGAGHASTRSLVALAPIALVGTLLAAGQYDTLTYGITYLHADAALSLAAAGLVLAMAQVGGTLARIAVGMVRDRLGIDTGHAVAAVAIVGCASLIAFSTFPHAPLAAWWVLSFFLGVGAIGWNALVLTWAGERAAVGLQATAMGISGSGVFLGATVFPPLFGAVATATGSLPMAWRSVALLYALAVGLVFWQSRPRPGRTAEASAPVAG